MANENDERPSGIYTSPVTLIRVTSILFVFLMVGHMSAYPWISAEATAGERQLVASMRSVPLVFFGQRSSYWNLYYGWGWWVAVLLITLAAILWLLSGMTHLAPRRIGVIAASLSVICLAGAYISFRFFYQPPFIMLSVMCIIMATAAAQLLRQGRQPG